MTLSLINYVFVLARSPSSTKTTFAAEVLNFFFNSGVLTSFSVSLISATEFRIGSEFSTFLGRHAPYEPMNILPLFDFLSPFPISFLDVIYNKKDDKGSLIVEILKKGVATIKMINYSINNYFKLNCDNCDNVSSFFFFESKAIKNFKDNYLNMKQFYYHCKSITDVDLIVFLQPKHHYVR